MRSFYTVLLALFISLLPIRAFSQTTCEAGSTCVPPADLSAFVQLAKDQQCRNNTAPKLQMDPIIIVTDKDGRVYGSGGDPKPYKLHLDWCNYQLDATGSVKLVAAEHVQSDWGFRLRPKFSSGLLILDAINQPKVQDGLDAGLMADFFYWKYLNVNIFAGFRSVGADLGVDLTKNFGSYIGYGLTYSGRSNPFVGLYFGF